MRSARERAGREACEHLRLEVSLVALSHAVAPLQRERGIVGFEEHDATKDVPRGLERDRHDSA